MYNDLTSNDGRNAMTNYFDTNLAYDMKQEAEVCRAGKTTAEYREEYKANRDRYDYNPGDYEGDEE
jgi:hypothetical protein